MKMKCSVCGKRFMPDKESVYLVHDPVTVFTVLSTAQSVSDAIDCPRCGCQALLKKRLQKIEERKNENEAEGET